MSDHGSDQIPVGGHHPNGTPGRGQAPVRQLVRDPSTRLGGVASGLASYFGLDPSLVRLGFIITTFFSGTGLIAYLVAWLVIPRAPHWPPADGAPAGQSITGRELGIGLAILLLLFVLFVNGGDTARILVPVMLVGGGVWLLRQPEIGAGHDHGWAAPDPGARSTAETRVGGSATTTGPFGTATDPQPIDTLVEPPPPTAHPAPGTPVPPRTRRRWGRVIGALLVVFLLIPLLVIGLVIGLILGNGIDIGSGFDATYRPQTVADLDRPFLHDAGEVTLDLTGLDLDGFDDPDLDLPLDVDVELDLGELRVIVPEGLDLVIDAEAGLGDVRVFDREEDGIDVNVEYPADGDDPPLSLDLRVGAGEILVQRR